VHEEELHVLGVVDKEGLVARGRQVTGLLVATVTDLMKPLAADLGATGFVAVDCIRNIPWAWKWCP
jgi:hypothetical protein